MAMATLPTTHDAARASVQRTRDQARSAMIAMGSVGALEALCCAFNDLDVPGVLCQLSCYAAWVVAAVFYCRWLHSAYGDAVLLGRPPPRFTPQQAVASFFVPFVGFYRPYQVIVGLHEASDPREPGDARAPSSGAPSWEKPFPVRSWWALWLLAPVLTSILDNASVLTQLGSLDVLTDPSALLSQESGGDGVWRALAALIHVSLAVLAIGVVRSIVFRQGERLRRLEGRDP
jgi:hypothetical protein